MPHFARKAPRARRVAAGAAINAVVTHYELFGRDAIGEQFLLLHFGGGDDLRGMAPVGIADEAVPGALQLEAAVNRAVHAHRLDHVRDALAPAEITHCRAEEIVKAVEMNQIEVAERGSTKA